MAIQIPTVPKAVSMAFGVVMSVLTAAGAVYGLLKLDDRYSKTTDLQEAKEQIIEELRNEVSLNRAIMIRNLEREKLDIEFLLESAESDGEKHYLRSKIRAIDSALKELEE